MLLIYLISAVLAIFLFIEKDETLCDKTLSKSFMRQLHHGNMKHLTSNLVALTSLSYSIERIITWQYYLLIIITIYIISSFIDYLLSNQNIIHINCSIGFSGIVFGILGWSLINQRGFDQKLLMDLAILMYPSLTTPNISFSGHLVGLLSGMLTYLLLPA